MKLAEKYRDGVHLASPVFDGAAEEEIFNLAQKSWNVGDRSSDAVRWPDRRSRLTAKLRLV